MSPSASRSAHRPGSSAALHDLLHGGCGQQDSPLQRRGKGHGVRRRTGPAIHAGGAIVFLVVGSLSVIVGFKARVGAALLLTFLVLASYYFHPFWKLEGQAQQEQMIQFMKNLSMMGAMLFIVANGSGPMSVDSWLHKRATAPLTNGEFSHRQTWHRPITHTKHGSKP